MELVKGIVHVLTAPPPPPPPHHNYHPGAIYPHQTPGPHYGPPHHRPPPPHHGPLPPPHHGPPHHHASPARHHRPPGPPYHHGPHYPAPPPGHGGAGWIHPYGPPGSSLSQPRNADLQPEPSAPSAPSVVLHVHQANPPPYSETDPRYIYPKLA